jgi:hypothetical protein
MTTDPKSIVETGYDAMAERYLASFGAGDLNDCVEEWLGVPMFFAGNDPATNRASLDTAGFTALVDEMMTTDTALGPETWQWILARTTRRTSAPDGWG